MLIQRHDIMRGSAYFAVRALKYKLRIAHTVISAIYIREGERRYT